MSNLSNLIKEKNIKALILDMDGVITNTAGLHAEAWKKLCDSFLKQRGEQDGQNYKPFELKEDYRAYVDGVPRLDAMRKFMESRGITLQEGQPDDDADKDTVVGLGERKDLYFHELLKQNGVVVFDSAVQWVKEQQKKGLKTAIVSASRNCLTILRRAGLERLFEVRVDRVIAGELKLKNKPAPDIYLEAARQLGVKPEETAVFEDAAIGIEGAKAGGFALVVGVDHSFKKEALEMKGADLVIKGFGAEVKAKSESVNS
ncbi:HAD superfamily hydrolase (TIGR01509 family)/beta-phosphoglucomutase family hydrolase [Pontibacter ummariensis]|uniref:Haloacid dehalogenase superfamily, subfamily IA, variant 3 with third motif having DD or ED/beta-phosphoglucomutase family hydrolase n=1 Tax=Pontibacter ummariensis TaxID=1610492 RepID=A0A239FV79_9BACT|nr:beta-phosphoglucomutase family hydrolase [Pontibacter ummariensis]PRY11942.1 HAD superfamily hydrolase (TIGR01509 family)/beta-phosphoglucomutase family hydrolase [Pontibacter ummariensis]SNS59824.1 haloacid dehalogenase superfamily, subfamily IA, variant 3 with third motif having DD or ED/beta-phosphoglucomutase family hydrolase [Pontibacter ummariensis]